MNSVASILARGNVLLAPMAGVTEAPFRAICKRMGAGLTYTEMVSAKGLHHSPNATRARRLLTFAPDEVPCAVQLSGSDPAIMAEQARMIAERCGDTIALIDINMGCPVAKVVAKGEGSALMRTPERAAAIVRAVVSASGLPVTAKFRKGWDENDVNAVAFARLMEDAGASAVTVHGRTRGQFYRGQADWSVIADVKAAVSIPVIGNGDVYSAEDVRAMLERTGVDGVMVARGAQGNPWLFREARSLLETGQSIAGPTAFERIDVAREHARELVLQSGAPAVARMRKHIAWYMTGLPGATHVRARAFACKDHRELDELLLEYREYLASRPVRESA